MFFSVINMNRRVREKGGSSMDSKKLFCFILMVLAGSIILTSISVMLNRFTSKKAAWSVMELRLARQGLTATQRKAYGHPKEGYEVSDIRGGISVALPNQ